MRSILRFSWEFLCRPIAEQDRTKEMNDRNVNSSKVVSTTGAKKKPYSSPALQEYGKLNRVTQGQGSVQSDGSSGMIMFVPGG